MGLAGLHGIAMMEPNSVGPAKWSLENRCNCVQVHRSWWALGTVLTSPQNPLE